MVVDCADMLGSGYVSYLHVYEYVPVWVLCWAICVDLRLLHVHLMFVMKWSPSLRWLKGWCWPQNVWLQAAPNDSCHRYPRIRCGIRWRAPQQRWWRSVLMSQKQVMYVFGVSWSRSRSPCDLFFIETAIACFHVWLPTDRAKRALNKAAAFAIRQRVHYNAMESVPFFLIWSAVGGIR